MAFDWSSYFPSNWQQQGQQGVQAINQMPWVWNAYTPQAAAAAVAPAPVPAAGSQTDEQNLLAQLLGLNPTAWQPVEENSMIVAPSPEQEQALLWRNSYYNM